MTSKTLNLVGLFLVLCSSLFAQQQTAQETITKNISGAQLTFVNNDTLYDYGGIPLGTGIPYQFEIKNTGDSLLIISGMKCESGNVQCKWPGKSIKPGKREYLTITYTAHGDEGSFKNVVYITSNATIKPFPLHIMGAITPPGDPYTPSSPASKSRGGRHGH